MSPCQLLMKDYLYLFNPVFGFYEMKICHVCAVDFTLKKLLLPLIDAQLREGYDVVSVCSDGKYIEGLLDEGYLIERISISRNISPLENLITIWKLFRFFRNESFDVIHVHTHVAAVLGRLAAFLARVPLVVYTAHGFYFHDGMTPVKRSIFILAEKIMRPFTDVLFTQSAEDAVDARDHGIMPNERIIAIGNGVDKSKFDPSLIYSDPNIFLGKDNIVIGMVSRLVKEKGVVEFLDAAKKISESHPYVLFVVIGERLTSDFSEGVEAEIVEAKEYLGDRLVLTGLRDDIPELLSVIDIFCLPSWREGLPRSIIEAMMMGLPVVATNIRGSREEVVHEETGLLVPVNSSTDLVMAFDRLIADSDLRRKLGLAGRMRAIEKYDETKVLALQIKMINDFMALK